MRNETPTISNTIVSNSLAQGVSHTLDLLVTTLTATVIPRALGPQRLGHFVYVAWLTRTASTFSSFGIPAAVRKYMAEYLGKQSPSIAGALFRRGLKFQITLGVSVVFVGCVLAIQSEDSHYRLMSILLVAAMLPGLAVSILAQANNARETLRANVPAPK